MTRKKALTLALSVAGVCGVILALLLISMPQAAVSHSSYTYKPGCHCGAPKKVTTTTKKVTTTTKKVTTTTAKKVTTTTKPKTTTTKPATTTTTGTSAKTTKTTKKPVKPSSTTSTSEDDDQTDALAAAAAGSGLPGGGDGAGGGTGGDGSEGAGLLDAEAAAAGSSGPPRYYLSPVAIAFLLVYAVSFAFYRTKRIRVTTHRKIWNVLLLGTFLMCGILGLVLAVGVTRPTPWELPTWLLVWHVETGIAMSIISFFHVGWHLRYYVALATGKRRAAKPERAAVRQRDIVDEPRRRPRPAGVAASVRTEAERRLAFEQRQAARGVRTVAALPAGGKSDAERWLDDARRRAVPAS